MIVKKGIGVSVVGSGPGKQNTIFVWPVVDIICCMTVLHLTCDPGAFVRDAVLWKGKFQHLIRSLEIASNHILAQ